MSAELAGRGQTVGTPADGSLTPDLLDRYGPLMTLKQIAELLGRSPQGVRVGLYSDNDTSALLAPAKLKIGRRLYFRTVVIGDALDLLGEAGQAR